MTVYNYFLWVLVITLFHFLLIKYYRFMFTILWAIETEFYEVASKAVHNILILVLSVICTGNIIHYFTTSTNVQSNKMAAIKRLLKFAVIDYYRSLLLKTCTFLPLQNLECAHWCASLIHISITFCDHG